MPLSIAFVDRFGSAAAVALRMMPGSHHRTTLADWLTAAGNGIGSRHDAAAALSWT